MISRIGSGHGFPAFERVRQVESGPAARSSTEARQAGARAAAVVRVSAEGRARAAAAEAEARAAAATPQERKLELEPPLTQPIPDFAFPSLAAREPLELHGLLEQRLDALTGGARR
jgi:hypothetical protein